jgi:dienelactone hydrolase
MLAQLGCVALAVDLYGDGKTTEVPEVARKLSGELKSNRPLLRLRLNAALEEPKKDPRVDTHETAAIGYCFGGTSVLELARSGAEVRGVVAFHPGLDSPNPSDGRNIKGRVLVCYGANDTASSAKDVEAFEPEVRQNNVDWEMNLYGNAGHGFTKSRRWQTGPSRSRLQRGCGPSLVAGDASLSRGALLRRRTDGKITPNPRAPQFL